MDFDEHVDTIKTMDAFPTPAELEVIMRRNLATRSKQEELLKVCDELEAQLKYNQKLLRLSVFCGFVEVVMLKAYEFPIVIPVTACCTSVAECVEFCKECLNDYKLSYREVTPETHYEVKVLAPKH